MKKTTTIMRVNKKIVTIFHYIMLLGMLHSSFIAPAQTMLYDYVNYKQVAYQSLSQKNAYNEIRENKHKTVTLENKTMPKEKQENQKQLLSATAPMLDKRLLYFNSDVKEGTIGKSKEAPLDDPADNLFKFVINQPLQTTDKVYISYDLFGVQNGSAVPRSINDRLATGGHTVKIQKEWSKQREELHPEWLHYGVNTILFSVHEGLQYQYKIKNLKIEIQPTSVQPVTSALHVYKYPDLLVKNDVMCIRGFIQTPDFTSAKVTIEGKEVKCTDGEFETLFTLTETSKQNKSITIQAFDKSGIIGQEVLPIDALVEADMLFPIISKGTTVKKNFKAYTAETIAAEDALLLITDKALPKDQELSITALRGVDLPPLPSGMINVTRGGKGYRFLPDGMHFDEPVKISLPYDQQVIPKGYSAKDIRTYYFNTQTKSWKVVQLDTIQEAENIIVSHTNHFTDYINGIIQTPDSPETTAFVPTMMNDIKAAHPGADMTIIAPPEVAQTGEANISYPIKIPAGRKGLQPGLTVHYSNEGSNGWLGQGWSLAVPAISIDTRWGTPLLKPLIETESYLLNGEQLMYPPLNGKDWMPNRHFDISNGSSAIYSTQDRDRITNAQFTLRKHNAVKIERKGSSTTQYYWKVTSTDGTVNWYGGNDKEGVIANTVIKDHTNNIVHWGLYMTEDVFGNCVKYEYTNYSLSNQSGSNANLNGSTVFTIKNIYYTGFNDDDYGYKIDFTTATTIREDVTINGRLGIKQAEPYFLTGILIQDNITNKVIRQYEFKQDYGKFNKGRIEYIAEQNGDGYEFYRHTFEYYDDLNQEGTDVYFSAGVEHTICNNDEETEEQCHCLFIPNNININNATITITGGNGVDSFTSLQDFKNWMTTQYEAQFSGTGSGYSFSMCASKWQVHNPTVTIQDNVTNIVYDLLSKPCEIENENQSFLNPVKNDDETKSKTETARFFKNRSNLQKAPYGSYTSTLERLKNKYVFNYSDDTEFGDPNCPSFLNFDFLLQGNIPSYDSAGALLGSTATEGFTIGGTLNVGIDFKWNVLTKSITIGGNFDYSWDKSESLTAMIDINGDGLDDFVFKKLGQLYWKRHYVDRVYNEENEIQITHRFGPIRPVNSKNNDINDFFLSKGESSSWGLHFSFYSFFAGYNQSKNKAKATVYFTDANADGLMDIVKNGRVYFNRLDQDGNPYFEAASYDTENMLIEAAPATIEEPELDLAAELPSYDVVKVWEAPADGTVTIENTIELTDSTKETVVTIEIEKQPLQCYTVSFPVPVGEIPGYKYSFPNEGYSKTSLNLVPDSCEKLSFSSQVHTFTVNNVNYLPLPARLFQGHFDESTDAITNLCDSVKNPAFAVKFQNWMNQNALSQFNIVENVVENTAYYIQPAQSSVGYNLYGSYFISTDVFNAGFNMLIDNVDFSNSPLTSYPMLLSGSVIPLNSTPVTLPVGVQTTVAINGIPLQNSFQYNIYNNFNQFKTDFQNQFPGSSISLQGQMVIITINNTTENFTSIALTPSLGSGYTYNFVENNCNPLLPPSMVQKNNPEWRSYKATQKEQELAVKHYNASGKNSEEPLDETYFYTTVFNMDNNGIDPSISGEYTLIQENKKNVWMHQGTVITNDKLLNTLQKIVPPSFKKTSAVIQEENKAFIIKQRQRIQHEAQQWLEKYYQNQENEKIQYRLQENARTASQSGCVKLPRALCMLFGTRLNATNTTVSNVLTKNCVGDTLTVKKGDRIYFRVHTIPVGNPVVNWNPKISYTNPALAAVTDQNGITPYKSAYSDGFILSQYQPVMFPGIGTATFEWEPLVVTAPTDQLTYQIIKRTPVGDTFQESILYSYVCPPNVTTTVSPVGIGTVAVTVNGTQFAFRVSSTSNVDWKTLEWRPAMVCTTTASIIGDANTSEGDVTTIETKYPIVDYSIYKPYTCAAPYNTFDSSSYSSSPGLGILPQVSSSLFSSTDNGVLYFVVKRNNSFIGKRTITITNGTPVIDIPLAIPLGTGSSELEIGFYTDDSQRPMNHPTDVSLLQKLVAATSLAVLESGVNSYPIATEKINLYSKPVSFFGPMYRQWGQFLYNPKKVTGAVTIPALGIQLLKEEELTLSDSQVTAINNAIYTAPGSTNLTPAVTTLDNFDIDAPNAEDNLLNILEQMNAQTAVNNNPFLRANPVRDVDNGGYLERWIGMHEENYASAFSGRAANMTQAFHFATDDTAIQGAINTGAYGIAKYSEGKAKSISARGSLGFAGAGVSKSLDGSSRNLTDYIDLNGDRYPDLVSQGQIQFTKKTGGLFEQVSRGTFAGDMSVDRSSNWGVSASGSFTKSGKSNSSGTQKPADGKKNTGKPEAYSYGGGNTALGVSGNYGQGDSDTSRLWADVNGDGLPDIITRTGNTVTVLLNLGNNTFSTTNYWGNFTLSKGSSSSYGGGLGYNFANGSIEAGISLGRTDSDADLSLIDINGDGLPDRVRSFSALFSNTLSVSYNLGSRFSDLDIPLSNFSMKRSSRSVTSGLNATGTYSPITPIYAIFFVFPMKFYSIGITASGSYATNKTRKTISDFDGDGYPDLLEEVNTTTLRVHHSRIRRTDMLKTVHNPLGGSFTIDYKVKNKTYGNPQAKWVMSQLTVHDGYNLANDGKDAYVKNFEYSKGKYDRRERAFYGYETVKVIDKILNEDNEVTGIYRTSVSNYHNESYFLNGLLKESYIMQGDDETKLFSKKVNNYELKAIEGSTINQSANLPLTFDVGGREGRRTAAVQLAGTTTFLYELNAAPLLVTEEYMEYDNKGRIVTYSHSGDLTITNDGYTTEIEYHEDTPLQIKNIITVPKISRVFNQGNNELMRQRSTTVDTDTGAVLAVTAYLDGTNDPVSALEYDNYGNLIRIELPPNHNQEAMFYEYEYDPTYHKYIVETRNAFGYTSSAMYDPHSDKITSSTDITGTTMYYHYDSFYRNIRILAPKEINEGIRYTIEFTYFPFAETVENQGYSLCENSNRNFVPFALTRHYDHFHPDNPIETITFTDGLGRPVQIKKDIHLNTGTPESPVWEEAMSVSGKVAYDLFGRGIEQFHPYYELKNCQDNFYINEHESPYSALTYYDELDRVIKTTDAEGNEGTLHYSIATDNIGDMRIKTRAVTDQNSSQQLITESYKDVFGRVTATKTIGAADLWTNFYFDGIGQLRRYKDAENLSTTYRYDKLGRKLEMNHPDKGKVTYTYDKAGNLTRVQTPNMLNNNALPPANRFIKYYYEYNRLTQIKYPVASSWLQNLSDVTYAYGASGNETGRIVTQDDASGQQEFQYGNMGEMLYNKRTVVGPNIPVRVFETTFEYDSFNRLKIIGYPDGEKVSYDYDLGGNLNRMTGVINGDPFDYIEQIHYDHYEQRIYMKYGNGADNFYEYTPALRRLNNLNARTSGSEDLFQTTYTYDKVGNVLSTVNTASPTANGMGGYYEHHYTYDAHNRLAQAEGEFGGDPGQQYNNNDYQSDYRLYMTYNATHGITNKKQDHIKNTISVSANSYSNDYTYHPGTHKVKDITNGVDTEQFDYDANGNMTRRTGTTVPDRNLYWDESDRLRVVEEEYTMQHYIYDAGGERVLKANTDVVSVNENGTLTAQNITINGYTTYPSGFIVVDVNGNYSKHYYAGSQRVVSRLGDEDARIFEIQPPSPPGNLLKVQQQQIKDLQQYVEKDKQPAQFKFKTFKTWDNREEEEEEENSTARAPQPAPVYFYHPDHLGTSTFLTDLNGNAYQFFLNLPFGETMAEQLGTGYYNTPYKFNGKELDEETGLYYYGARYYDPRTSIWLSVDPLAEEYPNISPYTYVANNPIGNIDPDGRQIIGVTKKDAQNFKADIHKVLADEKFAGVRTLIDVKGSTFKSIDAKALSTALDGVSLSADEKAYIDMVTNTINSKDVHKIEYLSGEFTSTEGATAFKDHMNKTQAGVGDAMVPNGKLSASLIDTMVGGGLNVPTKNGSHSFIGSGVTGDERAVTSGHELFGHGIPSARHFGAKANNANAIRTDNLIRRLLGMPERDGSDHGGFKEGHITEPKKLPVTE